MRKIFTFILCLSCLMSCDETAYPFEPNLGGFMPGGLPVSFDKSLKQSNKILDQQIDRVLEQIERHAYDRPHQKPIAELALSIHQKIEELEQEIADLRAEMANPKGLFLYDGDLHGKSSEMRRASYESQGFNNFKMIEDSYFDGMMVDLSNRSLVTKIFISEGKGEALKQILQATRSQILGEIKGFIKTKGYTIKGVRFEMTDFGTLERDFALAEIPDYDDLQWGRQVFEKLNLGNASALLRQYEHEAKNAVLQSIIYLSSNMGRVAMVYDEFEVFASSPKPLIRLGETYEAEIALGAYSSQAEFSVNVGGRALKIVDGKAQFRATPGSVGTKAYKANITLVNPLTGETKKVSKEFKYEVIDK